MKRSSLEVAGGPKLRDLRPAVAGRPGIVTAASVFSMVSAQPDRLAIALQEAERLTDFADFMSGMDQAGPCAMPTSDPSFRERLRRRLWRAFVTGYLRGGGSLTH